MRNDNFNVAKKLNWLKKVLSLDKKNESKFESDNSWQKKVWQSIFWQNLFGTKENILFCQKLKIGILFCQNLKLARHRNWQKHENCIFGQLVLICWPFEHLLHTQNINIIADLGGCWWGYDWKRRVKALQTFYSSFFLL